MLFFQIFGYYISQINSLEKNYIIWKFESYDQFGNLTMQDPIWLKGQVMSS